MHPTLPLLASTDFPPIRRHQLETLQVALGVNVIDRCNRTIVFESGQANLSAFLVGQTYADTGAAP